MFHNGKLFWHLVRVHSLTYLNKLRSVDNNLSNSPRMHVSEKHDPPVVRKFSRFLRNALGTLSRRRERCACGPAPAGVGRTAVMISPGKFDACGRKVETFRGLRKSSMYWGPGSRIRICISRDDGCRFGRRG
jgi:hypothetical protein